MDVYRALCLITFIYIVQVFAQEKDCLHLTAPDFVNTGSDALLSCKLGDDIEDNAGLINWYKDRTYVYRFNLYTRIGSPQSGYNASKVDGEYTNATKTHALTLKKVDLGDENIWKCVFSAVPGVPCHDEEDSKYLEVHAIATIEYLNDTSLNPLYNEDFTLTCIGAGNKRSVHWTKHGADLPEGDFEPEVSGEVTGSFSYGQTIAWSSSYSWVRPELRCDLVARHDGEYQCLVQATAGGESTEERESVNVTVRYPPLSRSGLTHHELTAKVGDSVELDCDACAHPVVASYTWVYSSSNISQNQKILLTDVDEQDFGMYMCTACNSVGCGLLTFNLMAKGTDKSSTGAIVGGAIGMLLLGAALGSLLTFVVLKNRITVPGPADGSSPHDNGTSGLSEGPYYNLASSPDKEYAVIDQPGEGNRGFDTTDQGNNGGGKGHYNTPGRAQQPLPSVYDRLQVAEYEMIPADRG